MATSQSLRQAYAELLERYGQLVADAFMQAVSDVRSSAPVQLLTTAIEAGDIDGALDALDIDPADFNDVLERIRQSHSEAGRIAVEALPKRNPQGEALRIRFDGRNPDAERWLAEHSSRLVSRIVEDQRQAVRESLSAGMRAGRNPRSTALDIVGRINRVTGKREGGIIGLTSAQAGYVENARAELASPDPAVLRGYLERGRRDRRFDRSINAAIREERTLDPQTAANALRAYENRLLRLRGETIGRTETLTAMNRAAYESIRQAVEGGKIQANAVKRVWRSAGDFRVRHTHRSLNAESVGLNGAFVSPSGARMMFPGDTSLGAPSSETIGCRCWCETRVDWFANLR